jgi:heterodisulfide reductase subunit B
MKVFTYYPGCSIKGTARQYEESLLAVFDELGITLEELPDWNCCGATMYMSVDEEISFALSARNLALAEQYGRDIVAPCSACYLVLKKTQDYILRYPELRVRIGRALARADLLYRGRVKVRHPLEVLITEVGLEEIASRAHLSLQSFRIAPYYGCQIVRPYQEFDHARYPVMMDQLFSALGARVVDYPIKTQCCGGSLMGTMEAVGLRLNYILLREACNRGANCIVTVCPLCQFNLEMYQKKIRKKFGGLKEIPVLYFTQLLGIALDLPAERLGIQRAVIPPTQLLEKVRAEYPAAATGAV